MRINHNTFLTLATVFGIICLATASNAQSTDTGYVLESYTVVITPTGTQNGTNDVSVAASLSGPNGQPLAYATLQRYIAVYGITGDVDATWHRYISTSGGVSWSVKATAQAAGVLQSDSIASASCTSDCTSVVNGVAAKAKGATGSAGQPYSTPTDIERGNGPGSAVAGTVHLHAHAEDSNPSCSSTGSVEGVIAVPADLAIALQNKPFGLRRFMAHCVTRISRFNRSSRISRSKRAAHVVVRRHIA